MFYLIYQQLKEVTLVVFLYIKFSITFFIFFIQVVNGHLYLLIIKAVKKKFLIKRYITIFANGVVTTALKSFLETALNPFEMNWIYLKLISMAVIPSEKKVENQ